MNADEFEIKVLALLDELGAVRLARDVEDLNERRLFPCTRGGPLWAQPTDPRWGSMFVAMRFEYPEVAASRVSGPLNPHSGKWNFHPPTLDEQALGELKRRLLGILVDVK